MGAVCSYDMDLHLRAQETLHPSHPMALGSLNSKSAHEHHPLIAWKFEVENNVLNWRKHCKLHENHLILTGRCLLQCPCPSIKFRNTLCVSKEGKVQIGWVRTLHLKDSVEDFAVWISPASNFSFASYARLFGQVAIISVDKAGLRGTACLCGRRTES